MSTSSAEQGLFTNGRWMRDWYELFNDQDFANWLRKHSVRLPIFEQNQGVYRILIKHPLRPEAPLPTGHWYKGGCARFLFLQRLNILCPPPRDVDVVRDAMIAVKDQTHPSLEDADDIERYGGWRPLDDGDLEVIDDELYHYFEERDFTINEVLANDHEVLFTKDALKAALSHEIRVSNFQRERVQYRPIELIKTFTRELRFCLELNEADPMNSWQIVDHLEDGLTQTLLDQYPFYILLHLDRLLNRSVAWADLYLDAWHQHGFFLEETNILAFARRLAQGLNKFYLPSSLYLQEHIDQLFAHLPKEERRNTRMSA